MNIFLLEDDFSLNEAIVETMNLYGYFVKSFFDGLSAYENLCFSSDLYILDINTPNLDGHDILKYIKKSNPNSTVFMISAFTDINEIKKSYEYGCDDFIKKPFDIEELVLKIEKLKEKKQMQTKKLSTNLEYCFTNKKLYLFGKDLILTKNENLLINLLVQNIGKRVSYEQIENFVYNGNNKSPNAINSMIKRLRKKIHDNIILNSIEEGYYIPIF